MSQQTINLGAAANDGTGTTLRAGGTIINANFTELYGLSFVPDAGWGANGDNGSKTVQLPANTGPSDYLTAIEAMNVAVANSGTLLFQAIEKLKAVERALAQRQIPTYP